MGLLKPRYAVAQAIVLAAWALDWYRNGASDAPGGAPFVGPLLFVGLIAGLPAMFVGLIDGAIGGDGANLGRRVAAAVLVVGLALWTSLFGVSSIYLEDLFGQTGRPPSVQSRVGGLIAMEAVFLLEFGLASLLRRRTGG